MIPLSIMLTYLSFWASYPNSWSSCSKIFPTITAPSYPAFSAMVLQGILMDFLTMSIPTYWSKLSHFKFSNILEAYNKAAPPPTTIPSSTAALVEHKASSILSLISPTSTSEAPPTLMIPTPPFNLANLSYNFSLSYSEVEEIIPSLIYSTLSSMADFSPVPSKMMVSSLVMMMDLQVPKTVGSDFSKESPISSEITVPPVRMAISFKIAFLLSPKAGALTAAILSPPLNLFKTKVAKASDSTSSQMIKRDLWACIACSK
mmetsp:Transcript_10572/g.1664  ORF Transcript_10572/g.1664 Transcript_10572/m.1664 type:complete len:260 (+) Transcript_10572:322-1101(+)